MVDNESIYFFEGLKAKLLEKLPAELAFRKLSVTGRLNYSPNERTRKSAILILIYRSKNEYIIPLILRPKYDGVHGGQMAFPGGRAEKIDKNLVETALREAQEEIGVKSQDVQILGSLTEIYIPPSNYLVQPIVGFLDYKPDFYPDLKEVDQIFEVSINEMSCSSNLLEEQLDLNGESTLVKYYKLQDQKVWGATAMMIAEFLMVLEEK